VSDTLPILLVMGMGMAAGGLGALLGLGGGVFLVPLLTGVLDLPVQKAAGISLMTVIAASGTVTGGTAGSGVVNLRLGMLLLVFASIGGLTGGITAQHLTERTLTLIFAVTTAVVALVTVSRLDQVNVIEATSGEPNRFGGRFFEPKRGYDVVYRVQRLPLALAVSLVAGNVSGLLGLGGGILQVPALTAWCGVPIRVAAATSAFLIGVTALASAPIYYAHGDVMPYLAAAAVLGVTVGARIGLRWSPHLAPRQLKVLLAATLVAVSALMFARLL
jgi:uncharacterized membrane protein YfcA